MESGIEIGTKLKTIDGKTITVLDLLGEGGQGYVYLVDYDSTKKALKWYKKNQLGSMPQKFYENLVTNKEKMSPSKEFLWPIDITEWEDGTFGYVMDLLKDGYYSITEFILGNVKFKDFKVICDATLNLVSAFRKLHNRGYSYQDLNDGNFFINPKNGNLLIGDNDNVVPDNNFTGVLGKPRYMAPEIVIGKGDVKPNITSDLYSLSLLIFMLFTNTHPLEGKKVVNTPNRDVLDKTLYGSEAVFIMDSNDKSNAPHPKLHQNIISIWPYLPSYMKDIFLKAFSKEALIKGIGRPKEIEWLKNLARFRNDIVYCKKCGNSAFAEKTDICDCCSENLNIKYKLKIDDYTIPAVEDTRIYNFQVSACKVEEALNPVARIIKNKNNEDLLAIVNLSNKIWNATTPSGKTKKVANKELIPLKEGINIMVENLKIEIIKN